MDTAESLERTVAEGALAEGLLLPGDAVLVAVSAGGDSAALAALLAAGAAHGLPLSLVLGHVDHGWRGEAEAALDLAAVTALAERLGLPLACAGPPERVRRTEDAARRFRYAALSSLARERGLSKVATGHHLRDQAETFLLRLLRGSGPAGLAGIPVRRPLDDGALEVVRPILSIDPARLAAYAAERGLPHRDDPTNAALDRDRSRVRARLLALGAREGEVSRSLARVAGRLGARVARREAALRTALASSTETHVEAHAVVVEARALQSLPADDLPAALRVLGEGLRADREGPWFTRRHVVLARELLADEADGKTVALPRGLVLVRLGRRVLLARREAPPLAPVTLEGPAAAASAGRFTVRRTDVPAASFNLDAFLAERSGVLGTSGSRGAFDADRLGTNLLFRSADPADRFVPLGRDRETPISTFLSKQGVPGLLRRGVRVLETPSGIAWVVGWRVDARFAVTPSTTRTATLETRVSSLTG